MYKRPRSVLLDFSQSLFLSSRAAKRTSNSASRARSRSLARSIACWPRGLFYNKKSCHRSSEITLVRPRSFYSISPSKSTPQAPRSASTELPWNTGSTPFHGRRERCSIAAPSSVSRSEPLPNASKQRIFPRSALGNRLTKIGSLVTALIAGGRPRAIQVMHAADTSSTMPDLRDDVRLAVSETLNELGVI